jgi:3,4-dihydroxy 2-butanone 4-phosphate synthase / GTP cyclohydrolase II
MSDSTPTDVPLIRYAQAAIPTTHGVFDLIVYREGDDGPEHLAIALGAFPTDEPVFVRVHSECLTGEILGSLKCDCGDQLEQALATIERRGHGVVVYLRQEGRGIGLGNKIRAYALQAEGADTIEANHMLGFETDLRDFGIAGRILRDLGVSRIALHTNNPDKRLALEAAGIEVTEQLPAHGRVNRHNLRYLETKHRSLGHELSALLSPRVYARRR